MHNTGHFSMLGLGDIVSSFDISNFEYTCMLRITNDILLILNMD